MLVSVSGVFRVDNIGDLDAQTDLVMDALLEIESASGGRVSNPDVTATLASGIVQISVVVDADSIEDGQRLGSELIEAAIIAANGNVLNEPHPTPSAVGFVEESRRADLVPA